MKQISAAFLKAQQEMGNAIKDSQNPFFRSKYADLNSVREACIPSLNKYGIAVIQPTCTIDGKNYVKTILLHESGESIESLTEILISKANDAQQQGSGITYARRYGLQSLVCIGAEDDDANLATHGSSAPTQQPQKNEPEKWLNIYSDKEKTKISPEFQNAVKALKEGKTIADIRKHYKVSKEVESALQNAINQ